MSYQYRLLLMVAAVFIMLSNTVSAQIIDIEDFGTGTYPGAPLPSTQTSYIYNAPAQPANFPNILDDGEYVLATDSRQGFTNWSSIGDNTTGTGYMMLVNADENQSGEFYRRQVPLTANTTFDFLAHLVTVNSQTDFDFCTANEGGLVLPNVTLQIEDGSGAILASFDTGDIPFNPVPIWEEYKLTFTTPASTSTVDVVLINNSLGGCGNDLAIDDIIFRIAVTMEANDDSITLTNTDTLQSAVLILGDNDTLNGNPLPGTELYFVATGSSLPSGITLNPNTGEVDVAAGTPQGTYSFDYTVCETSSQNNCDTATATIIIDFPPAVITASDDSGSVANSSLGFTPVLNILDNDSIDGTAPPTSFDLSISTGSTLPPQLSFNPNTGAVGVVQNAPSGIYVFDYDLCEAGDPSNCETATVTIDVSNPNAGPFCPAGTSNTFGTFHVTSATGASNPNRALGAPLAEGSQDTGANSGTTFFPSIIYDLTGDPGIIVPEGAVIEVSLASHFGSNAQIAISASLDNNNFPAAGSADSQLANLNSTNNTFIYFDYTVPAGGARFMELDHQTGGIRFDGVIFDVLCTPPPSAIIAAADDNGSVSDASLGDSLVLNVLGNDTIDGAAPASFDLALAPGASLPSGITFDPLTGDVSVLQGTATGVYNFDYELCQQGAPLNCDIATVTINVTNPNPPSICPAGSAPSMGRFHVVSVTSLNGTPNNPDGALGAPLPEGSQDNGSNETGVTFFQSLIYDLTGDDDILVPEGTTIDVSLANHFGSNPTGNILASVDGNSFTPLGNSAGPWTNNSFRYDPYIVPNGGLRFLQVEYGGGGGLRFDGVIYDTQCQSGGPALPSINAVKQVAIYDPSGLGLYAIPGNDVIYTITVNNTGTGDVDSGSLALIDALPGEIIFFNGDIDDAGPETGPVTFQDTGGGLSFDAANDLGFSNAAVKPADFANCTYTPTIDYDPDVTFVCFNPKGVMQGQSTWSVSFRSRIR